MTRIVVQSSTPWRVQAVLEWLLGEGYLDRPARGVYRINERGSLLFLALPTMKPQSFKTSSHIFNR
ncbi:winged helix-turn-helix domain-containing protein [Candidatus Bathyarchaeota archaeon]|nr:winged helix-turn-helix domain-containing protein [Candidatus Bathyarchaeota archaeon]